MLTNCIEIHGLRLAVIEHADTTIRAERRNLRASVIGLERRWVEARGVLARRERHKVGRGTADVLLETGVRRAALLHEAFEGLGALDERADVAREAGDELEQLGGRVLGRRRRECGNSALDVLERFLEILAQSGQTVGYRLVKTSGCMSRGYARGVDDTAKELAEGLREVRSSHAVAEVVFVTPRSGLLKKGPLAEASLGEGNLLL